MTGGSSTAHHLGDEALDADGEPVDLEELLQKGMVHVVVRLLEVVVELHHIRLFSPLHQIRGQVLDDCLFAPL